MSAAVMEAPVTGEDREATPPVWSRMGIALLALAGVLISVYMLLYKLRLLGTIACGTGACATVQESPWSVFLGAPVPAWGVLGYGALLGLALAALQPRFADDRRVSLALLGLAAGAFAFSLYLSALEAFVIHAWCRWCIASAVVATLVFLLSLLELPRLRREARHG